MNETPAMKRRNQHIAKVKSEIDRLLKSVYACERYTSNMPQWNWVEDWGALAQDVTDATDRAEEMARQTEHARVK